MQQQCIPPQSETLCFSSCLFKGPPPAPIGHLTHVWANTAHRVSRLALSCLQLPVSFTSAKNTGVNCVTVWHGSVVWCHKVTEWKVWLLTRCFRHSVFHGREELPMAWNLGFLTFITFYTHKNPLEHIQGKEKKHDRKIKKCLFNISIHIVSLIKREDHSQTPRNTT